MTSLAEDVHSFGMLGALSFESPKFTITELWSALCRIYRSILVHCMDEKSHYEALSYHMVTIGLRGGDG